MVAEYQQVYEQWLNDPLIDEQTKHELRKIAEQPQEIEDRFFRELAFGTGGLRGVLGAGTNRMNVYTVGKATQGVAQFVKSKHATVACPAAVIAYDSRHGSAAFALETALVFAANGIKAYLFSALRSTPELSFAVRYHQAHAGVVITASHNPPEYNGYKVYGDDGGQLIPDDAEQVIAQIRNLTGFDAVKRMSQQEAEDAGLLTWISDDTDQAFIAAVTALSRAEGKIADYKNPLNIVYTPLHGTGDLPVRAALAMVGFKNVHVVREQQQPDPEFSTVASPNPEEREAFTLAMDLAERVQADIILGTDPDCDRMGAVIRDGSGRFEVLTGNQTGALILHYLLETMTSKGEVPADGAVIKTIVTSELGAAIAQSYGLRVLNTLTGFKYIGEKITQFEHTKDTTFVFGYEESYGYLAGTHCRDKDAVSASMLICEAAAYYKEKGLSLHAVLQDIYTRYGHYREQLHARTMKGKAGMEQISAIMEAWRSQPPAEIAGIGIEHRLDYGQGIDGLPAENVLKFVLADGSWFCLRPSGTEPKIKLYVAVRATTSEAAEKQISQLSQAILEQIDAV